MNKVHLTLNYDEIKKRIEVDKASHSVKEWAKLVGMSSASISNIHGKSAKAKPSLEYIIAVAKVTGKHVEWYLYGDAAG